MLSWWASAGCSALRTASTGTSTNRWLIITAGRTWNCQQPGN